MLGNSWHKKEMPLVSLIGMGGGIASPAFLASIVLNILKPTVFSPADDTGAPDFDYTAESSAITNTSSLTTLDDFTHITSRTGQYEYIESDVNGSVFVTADVSSSNYFEISTDGGATWSNSNTVTSTPWLSLRGHCFVDSSSYKGFIFSSYGPTGSGGDTPTFKSAQGNYLSWSQAGTIPSYSSSQGRYDQIATDNDGFIVACGSSSNVAYSTDNADSWTRVSPGSGGTADSFPHWSAATYFAKLGKFVISTGSQSSSGNNIYLSGDKSQVQSGSWTIHDSASNPSPGISDMACNDDYLFALCGSYSGSALWRTSDLTSWTKIADFEATNSDMCPYYIKVKGSTVILIDFLYRGPNTGDIIVSTDNGSNWIYKKINASGDTFGSLDAAIDKDNNIVAVNDRKSPRVARTKLNATTALTLTDTTVSKVSDGTLIEGTTIDQVLTVGETVQADTAVASTVSVPLFSTTLYTGNGSTQTINNGIDLSGEGGLVWIKKRSAVDDHYFFDTERGINRWLQTNNSNEEAAGSNRLTAFNSNGFSVGTDNINTNNDEYASWTFRKAPDFFDVVTYDATNYVPQTIPHSLGSTPGMIIAKNLDSGWNWAVYHKDGGENGNVRNGVLNASLKFSSTSDQWDNTFPTDKVFTVGNSNDTNRNTDKHVAYLFADTPGKIKCGSYTGTGAAQHIETGFEVGWLMVKAADDAGSWFIIDPKRGFNANDGSPIYADQNYPENTSMSGITGPQNFGKTTGFGVQLSGQEYNSAGRNYIYVAIAENAEVDITTQSTASGTVSASSGNTITLSNTSGTWSTGMKVQGVDTDTKDNPDPILAENVSLTSSAPTAERNVNTWGDAVWEIATDENFTQNVQTATTALSATGTQAGPSFTLEAETGYYTRTKYTALGQESEWSDVTYFVTTQNVYVDDVFSTYLYEGNGSTQTINNGIDLAGEGGLVWIKNRVSTTFNHCLFDTERGATKFLLSNGTSGTDPEYTNTDSLTGFNSDGFDLGSYGDVNANTLDICSWTFRKAPGFLDIVTYTGTGANLSIAHSLGSVPGCILIKCTSIAGNDWIVYHRSVDNTKYLNLNRHYGASTDPAAWNNSTPTSTVFYLGGKGQVNTSGQSYVAYIFAHDDARFGTNGDESIIKCGSYTGTGSAYNEIDVGFEPQFVMFKNASQGSSWFLMDTMRGLTADGSTDEYLFADTTSAAATSSFMYPTSTGFGFTATGAGANASGDTYIYMAIRRPHKPPTAATEVFTGALYGTPGGGGATEWRPENVDMAWFAKRGGHARNFQIADRLRGFQFTNANSDDSYTTPTLWTNGTNAESTSGNAIHQSNYSSGEIDVRAISSGSNFLFYRFKRAPGFFDVVAYTGNGVNGRNISHNLEAVPEFIITKRRDSSNNWTCYSAITGNNQVMYMNVNTIYAVQSSTVWNNTTPTNSVFTISSSSEVNINAGTYIAYLFATLDGISKVGSYTGTGSNINVDCGFTAGARFVLIKRTDSTGDWYVWDTERGIVSGDDPYLTLNTTDAEVTNTDYIDPLNAGFTVTSSAPAALNASGGTYMFLAIA